MGSTGQTSTDSADSIMLRLFTLLALARSSTSLTCLSCSSETVDCPIRRNSSVSIAVTDCEGGWCETEFRRGSDLPASLRCIQSDPTQEKVTWSPYAQINKQKNIWCQWPAFGLADVRCVCQGEDNCNNLPKPGGGNRNNSPSLSPLPLLPLLIISYFTN